jgi:hypothetical protein
MMPDRVTLPPSRRDILSAQSSSWTPSAGALSGSSPGLQAHQVHRDHEDLVVILRIARSLDRVFAEIGDIEADLTGELVQRNQYFVARQGRRLAGGAPTEIRTLAGRHRGQHLGRVLLLRDEFHLDLHTLVGVRLVEGIDGTGPDLTVGCGEPAPMDDLDRIGGAQRARQQSGHGGRAGHGRG